MNRLEVKVRKQLEDEMVERKQLEGKVRKQLEDEMAEGRQLEGQETELAEENGAEFPVWLLIVLVVIIITIFVLALVALRGYNRCTSMTHQIRLMMKWIFERGGKHPDIPVV